MNSNPAGKSSSTELASRLRSAVLWSSGTTVLFQILSWGLTVQTARVLTATDYGVMALSQAVTPYLGLLASLNVGTWLTQKRELSEVEVGAMYGLTSALGMSMALAGVVIGPWLGAFFENDTMVPIFQLLCLTMVIQSTSNVPLALLRRDLRFKEVSVVNLATGVSSGVLQLVLAILGFGYWALAIGMIFRVTATALWALWYVGLPRTIGWNAAVNRDAIRFGLPATLAILAAVGFTSSDQIVIGRFFDVEFLGYYAMAFYLTDMPLARINEALRPIFLPYFARLQDDPERMRRHFALFTVTVAAVIFPVLIGIASVAEIAVPMVFGEKWRPMTVPLQVMCIVGLARAFIDNVPPLFLALGKPTPLLRFQLVFLLVMPVGFVVGSWTIGEWGIYLTWLILFPLLSLVALSTLRRETGIQIRDYATNLVAPLVSSLLMALVVIFIGWWFESRLSDGVTLLLQIILGAIVYGGSFLLVFPGPIREIYGAVASRG